MRRLAVLMLALVAATPAASAAGELPQRGALVPWENLGGVRLRMTPAQVKQAWGRTFGRCRGCARTTWYFNYAPFHAEGAAVQFRRGRVNGVWTLWKPPGWHVGPLTLGAPSAAISAKWPTLLTIPCGSYEARVATKRGVTTVFYVYGDKLWGFGLTRAGRSPCH